MNEPSVPLDVPSSEIEAFEKEGIVLWKILREKLAGKYEIVCLSAEKSRIMSDPAVDDNPVP